MYMYTHTHTHTNTNTNTYTGDEVTAEKHYTESIHIAQELNLSFWYPYKNLGQLKEKTGHTTGFSMWVWVYMCIYVFVFIYIERENICVFIHQQNLSFWSLYRHLGQRKEKD